MKTYIKSYFIKFLCIVVLFTTIPMSINSDVLSTIYTVIGIMFSIALSLIVTFSLQGIRSRGSIESLRYKLKILRKRHIVNFAIDTSLFLTFTMLNNKGLEMASITIKGVSITLNFALVILVLLVSSVFYYVMNFINIQKLNDKIFNELNDIN